MTKEITKAYILQQIQDRFRLRELSPEVFSFSETVIPVYNIQPHLIKQEIEFENTTVTGIGGVSFFEVPDTERWILNGYNVVFMAEGAYKVAGCYIARRNDYARLLYLDLTKNQTVSYAVNLPKPLLLDSGDRIRVNVDHFTSEADLRLYIDYSREELR